MEAQPDADTDPTSPGASGEVPESKDSVLMPPQSASDRPRIDCLLERAQALSESMNVNDPRGRLLQIALMRRDFILLHAVVSKADASYSRQTRTTWRPSKAGQVVMRITRPSTAPRRVPPHRSIPPRFVRGT